MSPAICPNCGMAFENESSVLKHMNHKFSSCNSFFLRGDPLPTAPNAPPDIPSMSHNFPHSTVFPGAAHIYGHGDGYMGTFHNDTHSGEREVNPYYPFQSKGEWEIASFLSQSGLSMKHIDEFLSLSLVRCHSSSSLHVIQNVLTWRLDLWARSLIPLCKGVTWPN